MCIRDRLHTLYQANLKGGTTFLNEWYAVDLVKNQRDQVVGCLLYTSDAADERSSVDLGGRRIIKKKNKTVCLGSHEQITTLNTCTRH